MSGQGTLFSLIVAPLLWGGNFVIGAYVADTLPGEWTNLLRWLIALVVLAPFCLVSAWRWRQTLLEHWRGIALAALLGVTLFNWVLYVALRYAPLAAVATGFAVTPFLISAMTAWLRNERPSRRVLLAAALSFAGMLLLQVSSLSTGAPVFGIILVLLAALIWAAYCTAVQSISVPAPGHAVYFAQVLAGVVLLLPMLLVSEIPHFSELSERDWLSLAYLGVFAAAAAFWLWQRAVMRAGAAKASVFMNLVPISTMLIGVVIAEVTLLPQDLLCIGLVFLGLFLSHRAQCERQGQHT